MSFFSFQAILPMHTKMNLRRTSVWDIMYLKLSLCSNAYGLIENKRKAQSTRNYADKKGISSFPANRTMR